MARAAAVLLLAAGLPLLAQTDPREAMATRIVETTALDRLILANARAKALADPKVEQRLDDLQYHVRPPATWNAQHPAWPAARTALRELVARESNEWVAEYWRTSALKTHVRELAGSYRADFLATVLELAQSPGGSAWFARRVAEARARAGESMFSLDPAAPAALEKSAADARRRFDALPPAEKERVRAFAEGDGRYLEIWIDGQSKWIAEVLVLHLGDIDYRKRDAWRAEIDTRLAGKLPVESKKQVLGTLEMRPDAALVFRFTFYWNDATDGGRLALDIPKSHPGYAETLALAPGLAARQSRVLYRDRDGVIGDKP